MHTDTESRAALETAVATLAGFLRPGATVFYRIGANHEPSGFELFGLAETMHRTWLQRYCVLDPMHPSRCAQQHGNVLTLGGELPETLRDASVYWRRFLKPYSVIDVMEVLLREQGRVAAAFSLLRFAPDAPFSEAEIAHANRLQPLLELALAPTWRREPALHAAPSATHATHAPPHAACAAPRLTQREEQIARLVRNGLSNKAIARDLELSQPTVKTHLLRMFRKLGVSSRTELIGALFL
ncbi:response regulator transcription factor [Paraburkholderia silviterrae]|uniref:Response regulator transcription factor n=1 Tax=Paraburkholderia silviterrae TaxID=2528715 RepID=A0A4R5LYC9_9BURK|nr:LuxR C-terminal-related transcriptional regulator [Paraburkholderia silviterrae]TDG17349.1 response regulator transcription factor [Paraburkholderia silviterrae]